MSAMHEPATLIACMIDRALRPVDDDIGPNVATFLTRLASMDVRVHPAVSPTTGRVSGLRFSAPALGVPYDASVKGSEIAQECAWSRLLARGLRHDQEADRPLWERSWETWKASAAAAVPPVPAWIAEFAPRFSLLDPKVDADKTPLAVWRTVRAWGADKVAMGVLWLDPERSVIRQVPDGDQPTYLTPTLLGAILDRAPAVKRWQALNAIGNGIGRNIYLRPADDVPVVLVDDLTPENLERMRADGVEPCVVLETSPGNLQAWVRVSWHPIPHKVRTEIAAILARKYHGDKAAARRDQLGRMPGFTNQKPTRLDTKGKGPWVRLVEATAMPMVCPAGWRLIDAAERRMAQRLSEDQARKVAREALGRRLAATVERVGPLPGRYPTDPAAEFERRAGEVIARSAGGRPDWSLIDLVIATAIIGDADSVDEGIARARRVLTYSSDLDIRKASPGAYIEHQIGAALLDRHGKIAAAHDRRQRYLEHMADRAQGPAASA